MDLDIIFPEILLRLVIGWFGLMALYVAFRMWLKEKENGRRTDD